MFIMHIALQGCLRAHDVPFGLTADTGGHIKYLLELVDAAEKAGAERQDIVVRRFEDPRLGRIYAQREERVSSRSRIMRIDGDTTRYLPKEELWPELPTLARNLIAEIARMDRVPDAVHAHYADAGWIGAEIRERLGIPLIFTAHSLGRVKAATLEAEPDGALRRRIAIEERAIAAADRIVTSSTDEAVGQYGLYASTEQSAIKVNPPGCDLTPAAASATTDHELERSVSRFLDDPSKRALLALARPVRKKNLVGLVEAYASSPELRDRANLVVFAGTRDDLADEEPENAAVLRELLLAVDRHDLWGSVALPKHHRPDQVPDIYAWARARRGVFVNTALNEPFGLTFLEAAAAGLPVVATRSGGPNDIVGNLEHGILVDPLVPSQTVEASLALLTDDVRYERCARNARERIGHYSWSRHADDYLRDVSRIAGRSVLMPNREIESRTNRGGYSERIDAVSTTSLVEGMRGARQATRKPVSSDATASSSIRIAAPRT